MFERTSGPDFAQLVQRLEARSYKCVAIFVDNSSFDVLLGVLPVVVELLAGGTTRVMLCANSKVAINDVTHDELVLVVKKACLVSQVLHEAFYDAKKLARIYNQ